MPAVISMARDQKWDCQVKHFKGQLVYGPPLGWLGSAPRRGCEVFVGGLPRDFSLEELVAITSTVGTIYQARLMITHTGANRGFGFVQYTKPHYAKLAISLLDGTAVRIGHKIGICLSLDINRLFIGGIPKDKSRQDIWDEMQKFAPGIVDITVYTSISDKTKNRGFLFADFTDHNAAAVTRRRLRTGKILLFGQIPVSDWAVPESYVKDEDMSEVKILYVRNIPILASECDIKQNFQSGLPENSIERVKKIKDFAFVHFHSREAAEYAKNKWNHKKVFGTEIEVQWAKPKDKLICTSGMIRNKAKNRFKYLQDTTQEYTRQETNNYSHPVSLPVYYASNVNFESHNRGAFNLQYTDQPCRYPPQNLTTGYEQLPSLQSDQGSAFGSIGQGNIAYAYEYMQPTQPTTFYVPTKTSGLSTIE